MENVRLISEEASDECVVVRVNQASKKDKSLTIDLKCLLVAASANPRHA